MRKTWRKILAWILIVIMEVSNNGIHALAVSDNGGVNESTNGYGVFDSTVVDECSVSFDLKDQWNDGYKAEVTIENNGAEAIQNWCISMGWNGIIAEIWNAEVCQVTEEGILLKNAGWNQDIEAGASVSFGFRGEGEFPGFPTKYVLWQGSRQISDEDYQFEYEVIDSWKDAFTAEITISNLSEHDAVEDWTIEFDYGGTIENIWNAVILSREGDHYVIQNAGYNGNVLPGQSISFGFNASGEEARPTDVRLRDEKPERGQESVVPVNPGESGEDQEPKPGEQETLWPKVLIDTAGLEIIEGTKEAFTINDSISLGGTLEGADNTKELYLLVLRDDGTEEGRREAEISPAWTIDGVELKIGPNYFVIVDY